LLAAARRLVDRSDGVVVGLWGRAAALLVRQALELVVRALYVRKAPRLRLAPLSTQMLCLSEFTADTDMARQVALAWSQLSAACHHRGYSTGPSARDLEAWIEAVERANAKLGEAQP